MASTVTNSDVKQELREKLNSEKEGQRRKKRNLADCFKGKDIDQAVVVAVTFAAVFGPEAEDGSTVYRLGMALPLLQVLQRVNERLLEKNPAEHQLFDVTLITTDSWQQQQNSSIINSTRHHGLEISRFCFSTEDNYIENLMQNNVQLFLTTDGNEALQATHHGVPSALLDKNLVSCPSEQLRVLFCENAIIQPNMGSTEASKKSAQNFLAHLGQMRQKFGVFDSPLCFTLVTSHGGKDSCCCALKSLRSLGVSVDEAYCLGGAPRGPILSLLRPHFLLSHGFSLLEA